MTENFGAQSGEQASGSEAAPTDRKAAPSRNSRRALLTGGVGTSLIVTLASRPALAWQQCNYSGAQSLHPSNTANYPPGGDKPSDWCGRQTSKWPCSNSSMNTYFSNCFKKTNTVAGKTYTCFGLDTNPTSWTTSSCDNYKILDAMNGVPVYCAIVKRSNGNVIISGGVLQRTTCQVDATFLAHLACGYLNSLWYTQYNKTNSAVCADHDTGINSMITNACAGPSQPTTTTVNSWTSSCGSTYMNTHNHCT